jgi:hypothetical protein
MRSADAIGTKPNGPLQAVWSRINGVTRFPLVSSCEFAKAVCNSWVARWYIFIPKIPLSSEFWGGLGMEKVGIHI